MKYITILIIILMPFFAISQEDYKKSIQIIDSILTSERQFFNSDNNYVTFFAPLQKISKTKKNGRYYWISSTNKKINRKYEKMIIKYLEGFIYDSLPNIRRVTIELIYSVGFYSTDFKIRKKTVNNLLDAHYISGSRHLIDNFNIEDFDKKAKKRIKEIISGEKSQIEIDYYVWERMKKIKKQKWRFEIIKQISKKDSLPYEYVRDSIFSEREQLIRNNFTKQIFCNQYILLAGRLYMYDYIQELEKIIIDKRYSNEEKNNAKLALARLGNTEYENEFLKAEFPRCTYINSQNSVKKYIEHLFSDKIGVDCYGDGTLLVPYSYNAYLVLQKWIIEFPNKLKSKAKSACSFTEYDIDKFEKTKKWFKKHKGNYKLKSDF